MPRSEALAEASNNKSALTNCHIFRSVYGDVKKANTKKSYNHDKEMAKTAGLKSCNAKTVCGTDVCYHCGKCWCIYSANDADYTCTETALAHKHLVRKQNLTWESPIEVSYFNYPERRLELKDLCIF